MNVTDFVKLIVDAVNYDNVSFPTLRFSSDLTKAEIVHPEKDKDGQPACVSHNLIAKLEQAYNWSGNTSTIPLTYKIHMNENKTISVTVNLTR